MPDTREPISFSYDPINHIRTAVFQDGVTDSDMINAYTGLLQAPVIVPEPNDLTDLRLVKKFSVTANGLRRLVSLFYGIEKPAVVTKLAIVGETDITFGISRMYQTFGENIVPKRIQVFRSMDDALRWLNEK